MTVEERAKELWGALEWVTDSEMLDDYTIKRGVEIVIQHLRDQIEECAKIAEHGGHPEYGFIAKEIRALAEPTEERKETEKEDREMNAKEIKEACAKICDDIENRYRERDQFEETNGMSTYSADAAQRCAFAIRQSEAWSEGEKKEKGD